MLIPLVGGGHQDGALYDTQKQKLVGFVPTGTKDRTTSTYELQQTPFGERYVFVFTQTVDDDYSGPSTIIDGETCPV